MRPADPRFPHESPRERHARLAAELAAGDVAQKPDAVVRLFEAQLAAVDASSSTSDALELNREGFLAVPAPKKKSKKKTKAKAAR